MITDEAGNIVGKLSFNAFGGHRGLNWSDNNVLAQLQLGAKDTTSRGYTGHEQLDDVGLIHMNGRVYDPGLGRFISADPQVQYVSNLQSYNRYSYVHNNPLSYTDPSGFGIWKKIKKAFRGTHYYKHFDKVRDFVKGNKYAQMAIQIAATYFGGPIGAALASAALTRLNGGNLGDMVRAGIMGGISGAIGGMDFGIGQVLTAAAFGGISTAMSGGDFVAGFAMAGFTAGLAPGLKGVSGFAVSTIVAGTASVMGGGKFANGAKSAAFGYMVGAALRGMETYAASKTPVLDANTEPSVSSTTPVAAGENQLAMNVRQGCSGNPGGLNCGGGGYGGSLIGGGGSRGTIYVDSKGNALPAPPGGRITGSPNGQYKQIRDATGKETGVRIDGGHNPKSHPDPRAQQPHGHVPGVTNPDGTPWLPIK